MYGQRPFKTHTGDQAANFWPLAVISFGESWHNSLHADPTCARHGVLPGQLDPSARLIWLLEKLGWVYDVRWPKSHRFTSLRAPRPVPNADRLTREILKPTWRPGFARACSAGLLAGKERPWLTTSI